MTAAALLLCSIIERVMMKDEDDVLVQPAVSLSE